MKLASEENVPDSRDEHTAVLYNNKMYIFGGFRRGVRTNSILVFDFTTDKWEKEIEANDLPNKVAPKPVAGHSAQVFEDSMYIFGGKDNENEKIKDFWKFDFKMNQWE